MESKYNIEAANNNNGPGESTSQLIDLTADSAEETNYNDSETDEELPYASSNELPDTRMARLLLENQKLRLKLAKLEQETKHGKKKHEHGRRNEKRCKESRKRSHSRELRIENPRYRPHAVNHVQSKQPNEFNLESPGKKNSNRLNNTDKSRYFNSESATICHLCHKKYTRRIVSHYKKDHPESEVFASRLSQKMVEEILSEKIIAVYEDQKGFPEPLVAGRCYFCDSVKRFQSHYWQQHYTTHTGEYMYECCICDKMVSSTKHCDSASKRIKPINNLRKDDLCGYLCFECNYVQLHEENMKRHQQHEHKYMEKLSERYKKVILLPSRQKMNSNNYSEGKQFSHKENIER